MSPLEQLEILTDALRQIGALAVPAGADPMPFLLEAQRLAAEALISAGIDPAEQTS